MTANANPLPDGGRGPKPIYVPFTPGGTCLMHLKARTEEQAWKNLLAYAPYPSIEALKARGYEVERLGHAP